MVLWCGELTQVPGGLDLATFGRCWRVGEYLLKKVHSYKSKFGQMHKFLSVDFDNLSADLEK